MTGDLNPELAPPEIPGPLPDAPKQCPACGTINASLACACSQCGADLTPADKYDTPSTVPMKRQPRTVSVERDSRPRFMLETTALLQFLPSGVCHTVDIRETLILGRTNTPTSERVLDLTDLNALAHGVSRRHCALQRRGEYLVVNDLGSVNGTFLNDQKLMPFVDHIVAHGDHLILGTLHLAVFFGGLDTSS